MIEPYQWLLVNAKHLGYAPEHVGPASVDLRLLGDIRCYKQVTLSDMQRRTMCFEHRITISQSILFEPGCFYLCSTIEAIKVPETHAAQVMMRSSLARKGLGHRMAGYIDPGFEGQITLELEATIPVEVMIGERIVQLIYHRLTEPTAEPYQGRYKGQRGPTEAYKPLEDV